MIRAFIAVDITERAKQQAEELLKAFMTSGRKVKWVNISRAHITVKFLGNIEEHLVPTIESALVEAASFYKPFTLLLRGCGAFPSLKRIRVIWVGVDGDVPILSDFKRKVDTCLEPLGFTKEAREFRPHVTLGRVVNTPSSNPDLAKLITSHLDFRTEPFEVKYVVLYRSILKPSGSEYHPLVKVAFGN